MTIPRTTTAHINIGQISKFINLLQKKKSTQEIYSIDDIAKCIDMGRVLQINIHIECQQMDSGANKNATNDKSIICKFLSTTPIPVVGVGDRQVTCEILDKRITEVTTLDDTTMDIYMFLRQSMQELLYYQIQL